MTGGPGKEDRTNEPPPTERVQERSERDTVCLTVSQDPYWHPSWLSNAYTTRRTLPQKGWPERTWKLIPSP